MKLPKNLLLEVKVTYRNGRQRYLVSAGEQVTLQSGESFYLSRGVKYSVLKVEQSQGWREPKGHMVRKVLLARVDSLKGHEND